MELAIRAAMMEVAALSEARIGEARASEANDGRVTATRVRLLTDFPLRGVAS
jgi:hypothetical protein